MKKCLPLPGLLFIFSFAFLMDDYKTIYYQGFAALKVKNYNSALSLFRKAYSLEPNPKIAYYIAYTFYFLDEIDSAALYGKKALYGQPNVTGMGQEYTRNCNYFIEKQRVDSALGIKHPLHPNVTDLFKDPVPDGNLTVTDPLANPNHDTDMQSSEAQDARKTKLERDSLLKISNRSLPFNYDTRALQRQQYLQLRRKKDRERKLAEIHFIYPVDSLRPSIK